jgi:hypothetical protein
MRRVTTVLVILVGILLAGSYYGWAGRQKKPKIIMLSEQSPGPITFPKIDRKPEPSHSGSREIKSLPKYDPDAPNVFAVNLRCRDLSKLDLRNSIDDLQHALFDDYTRWPKSGQMPEGFDPKKVMELGKNPGLGVRTLHKRGITGKGVSIAVIDQPLLTEHQEYADRLRLYEEHHVRVETRASFHGPAAASIAVGKTVGVAPDADLYYIASWSIDISKNDRPLNFVFKAQAIRRLLEINRQLPADRKIRVISMSRSWNPSHDGYDEIVAACEEAKAAGVFVVNCGGVREGSANPPYYGLGRHPLADPDDFKSYGRVSLGLPKDTYKQPQWRGYLLVPMDSRTMACARGSDKYVFFGVGGYSWVPPYLAGVYALAAQVEPEITPERFWALAVKTGRTIELEHQEKTHPFGLIIDPVRLIGSIKAGELSDLDRKQSDKQ